MLFLNEVHIGGKVAKVKRAEKITRVWVDIPAGDEEQDRNKGKTVTVQVDVTGDHHTKTEVLKAGDYFACVAQLINMKVQPDGKDTPYTIRWLQALGSQPLVMIPDGGKYVPAGVNRIYFSGRCQRVGDLRTNKTPSMIFVTVAFSPKLDKNATAEEKKNATVYTDVAFFGGTAEKYVQPYLKQGDAAMVTGYISPYEEEWKHKEKSVTAIRINGADIKFVTPVERDGSTKKSNSGKPDYEAYKGKSGGDDDLQF